MKTGVIGLPAVPSGLSHVGVLPGVTPSAPPRSSADFRPRLGFYGSHCDRDVSHLCRARNALEVFALPEAGVGLCDGGEGALVAGRQAFTEG